MLTTSIKWEKIKKVLIAKGPRQLLNRVHSIQKKKHYKMHFPHIFNFSSSGHLSFAMTILEEMLQLKQF